jgi:beta-glucanase (GH16 family)
MKRPLLLIPAIAALVVVCCALPAVAAAGSFRLYYGTGFGSIPYQKWRVFSGKPRCCSSRWSPSHVTTSHGILTIDASRNATGGGWTSGGLSMGRSMNLTYGAWSIRFRMDPGVGVKMCVLLWPKGRWPPEIDFAENSSADGARHLITSTLHYSSANRMIHNRRAVDYSNWHTMGVRWTPRKISYRLDGRVWAVVTSHIPSRPMHLGIQTTVGLSNGFGANPTSATPSHVGLHVDWVRIWRYVR